MRQGRPLAGSTPPLYCRIPWDTQTATARVTVDCPSPVASERDLTVAVERDSRVFSTREMAEEEMAVVKGLIVTSR
jgi:hypothetical protein